MTTAQTTAVVNIEPKQDEAVLKLGSEAIRVWQYAQKLEVRTTEDVRHATEDLSLIANIRKQLEAKRKEFVAPLDEYRKSIQEKFKTISGPVDEADKLLRDKIGAYNQEQRRLQQAAAEAQAHIDEAKRIQQELTGRTGEVFEPLPDVEAPPAAPVQRVYTGTGSMTTRRNRKWSVLDFGALPDMYKMVDATKLGKIVRAGIDEIPGVRIWEEEGLAITPVRPSSEAEQRERDHPQLEAQLEGGDAGQDNGDIPF